MEVLSGMLIGIGAIASLALSAIGSAVGTGKAGISGAAAVGEDPSVRTQVIILSALPSTQTIYGLVIFFMLYLPAMKLGLPLDKAALAGCLGVLYGLSGLFSAIYQGKVAAAGISMLSKNKDLTTYLILAGLVEFFALLCLMAVLLARNIIIG